MLFAQVGNGPGYCSGREWSSMSRSMACCSRADCRCQEAGAARATNESRSTRMTCASLSTGVPTSYSRRRSTSKIPRPLSMPELVPVPEPKVLAGRPPPPPSARSAAATALARATGSCASGVAPGLTSSSTISSPELLVSLSLPSAPHAAAALSSA